MDCNEFRRYGWKYPFLYQVLKRTKGYREADEVATVELSDTQEFRPCIVREPLFLLESKAVPFSIVQQCFVVYDEVVQELCAPAVNISPIAQFDKFGSKQEGFPSRETAVFEEERLAATLATLSDDRTAFCACMDKRNEWSFRAYCPKEDRLDLALQGVDRPIEFIIFADYYHWKWGEAGEAFGQGIDILRVPPDALKDVLTPPPTRYSSLHYN